MDIEKINNMNKSELLKLVLDQNSEIRSLRFASKIIPEMTPDKIFNRIGAVVNAQLEEKQKYENRTIYMEEYNNADWVRVKFIKEWLGWYDVVNAIGSIKSIKKIDNQYFEFAGGHGYPILRIPNDCVVEIKKKNKWWKRKGE